MEAILLEYAWVLVVLIVLEGLLAADNAVVMAVMVKHLPKDQQKKALFYGLFGAFVFRFAALFMITFLVNIWQIQALGAAYLLFISIKIIYDQRKGGDDHPDAKPRKKSGFWMTVLKVELADIAFALDSMLAAVALAVTLPELGNFHIGGINGGQFVSYVIRWNYRIDYHAFCCATVCRAIGEISNARNSSISYRWLGRCQIGRPDTGTSGFADSRYRVSHILLSGKRHSGLSLRESQ